MGLLYVLYSFKVNAVSDFEVRMQYYEFFHIRDSSHSFAWLTKFVLWKSRKYMTCDPDIKDYKVKSRKINCVEPTRSYSIRTEFGAETVDKSSYADIQIQARHRWNQHGNWKS